VASSSLDKAQKVVDAIAADGGRAKAFVCDVTSVSAIETLVKDVIAAFGRIDVLVNSAGVFYQTRVGETDEAMFDRMCDINLKGTFFACDAVAPHMIERGSGGIVNMSSGWGRSTSPNVAPYCASKYAIEGLTEALAQELPEGMAAVAINPGVVDTDMLRITWGDDAAAYSKPDEWARRAVPFMLKLEPADNGRPKTV